MDIHHHGGVEGNIQAELSGGGKDGQILSQDGVRLYFLQEGQKAVQLRQLLVADQIIQGNVKTNTMAVGEGDGLGQGAVVKIHIPSVEPHI